MPLTGIPLRKFGWMGAIGEDDREEVIRRRLRAYDELTGPILKWFGPSVVGSVDGTRSADQVALAVERVVLDAYCEMGVG
jgi:adenylate kinase family enzyme